MQNGKTNHEIGAVWTKTSAAGATYFEGLIHDLSGDIRIVIFKNLHKTTDRQPDFRILRSKTFTAKTVKTTVEAVQEKPTKKAGKKKVGA